MAGNAVIGALRVVLGADTAALDKGLKDARGSLAGFGNHMKVAGAAIAAALAGVIGGVAVAVKSTINEADKLGKLAQSIGIPVEELSRLKHAADLSGVSLESLTKGVGRLNRNMVESAQGLSTPTRAFEALGIQIKNTDGSLKTVSEIMPELAARFAKMRDGPEKTTFAMQLLGRAGAELIPMLNGGAEGLRSMMEEADQLGIVIDSQTAKAAENFNDNLTRLARVKDGIITLITARMLPALENLSQQLIDGVKNSNGMKTAGEGLMFVIKGLATAVISAWTSLKAFSAVLSGVIAAAIFAATGEFRNALDVLKTGGKEAAQAFVDSGKLIVDVWQERLPEAARKGGAEIAKAGAPIIQNAADIEKAAKAAEAALQKIYDRGRQTYEDTRTPAEAFGIQLQKINEEYAVGAYSADTYARAVQQIKWPSLTSAINDATNLQGALDRFSTSSLDGTASALTDIVTESKTAEDAFKDLGKAVVREFIQMIAKALVFKAVTASLGIFGGGGGLLSGFLGFAQGGSFTVPGGSSMTDTTTIPLNLAAGERVTVDRPDSPSANTQKQLQPIYMKPGPYSREEVRSLLSQIADVVGDGPGFKFA